MYRIIISILVIGLLTGCSIGEKKLKIFKLEEPRANLNLEVPTMPQLEKLRWIIITSDNAEEVFQKMEEDDGKSLVKWISMFICTVLLIVYLWLVLKVF